MAQFLTYKCKKCGYSVETEPQGHYALMSGEYYNFRCTACKNIVSIHVDTLADQFYLPKCPICGEANHTLYTWNPIEGHCPKCGDCMEVVPGSLVFAD